jgi:NAD(P)-dependent dehydrogenase (short-subunit alcohol dehydrogenase family)
MTTAGLVPGRYDGAVAVVTGGASGIGRAIVERLLAEGAFVVAGDMNGEALVGLAAENSERLRVVKADVTDEAQVEALAEEAISFRGRLDLGFNVAGIGGAGEILSQRAEDWQRVLDVCLTGVMFSIRQEAARISESAGQGAIVNVTSLNSTMPMYGGSAYCASKAGADMLTRCAALELADKHIRVNSVAPGFTKTPLTSPVMSIPALEAGYLEKIPLAVAAEPGDIAAAALFLASPDAGYITGTVLTVDGGWSTTGYPDLKTLLSAT